MLHKSFAFPRAESTARRIKPRSLFHGVTPLSCTSTNQFHYDHGLIRPNVPDPCSPGRREVPESKSNRQTLHPFPCLPLSHPRSHSELLSAASRADDISGGAVMEGHVSSSSHSYSPLFSSHLLSEFTRLIWLLHSVYIQLICPEHHTTGILLFTTTYNLSNTVFT